MQRVFVGQASPPALQCIGSHRPVPVLQLVPSAQAAVGQRGTHAGQHPPVQIIPSGQSGSLAHSPAHPAPPQTPPTTQLPHAQSELARQSSAFGVVPGQ